jgi:nicotinate-nucleotide adenylyltransferase
MKVGLFFGSFNPVHTGHLIIANHIVNFYMNEVWFIVSPQNPLKKQSDLLEANVRLDLLKVAIENNKSFKASDIEFDLPVPSYTITTLRKLSQQYNNIDFFLIIGSDNFCNFSSWNSYVEIINTYKILVYERPGFPIQSTSYANVEILNPALIDITSTRIRSLIRQGKSIRYLVPEIVHLAIEKSGYYR